VEEDEKDEVLGKFDRQFKEYAENNPGANFGDFYVQQAADSIAGNNPHPTLGRNLKSGMAWSQAGIEQLEFLKREGLRPQHTLVDYGCGSLRVGQHLIRYLNPGCYWGLDITDIFIQMGVEQLSPELLAERKPELRIMDPATLSEVRGVKPDFVYSRAVLRHVPPDELEAFFDKLMSVVAQKTRCVVTGMSAVDLERVSSNSWAHPQSMIAHHVERCGGAVQFETKPGFVKSEQASKSVRSVIIRIERRN
jgi:SAM-dependent methyltransferase